MFKSSKSAKALLVDDSAKVLEQEKNLLEKAGVKVITAGSGPEAIKKVHTEKPDIVFLDLFMPEMGGDVVCRLIKSDPKISDTAIIMVTASSEEKSMQSCFQSGCDAYVTKPFRAQELLRKLKVILDEKEIYLDWDRLLAS